MNICRVLAGIAILLLLFSSFTTGAQDDDQAPDSPLVTRAKDHLKTFSDNRDQAGNEAYLATSLALADSLEEAGDLVLASHCLERAGILHYYAGEIDEAVVIWESGVEVARRSEDPQRIGALLNAKAIGISAGGDNLRALEVQWELLEFRRESGDLKGEGSTWHNIAYSQRALFQFPEAVESLRNAIRIHREFENIPGLAASYQSLAPLLDRYILFEEALAIADSAVVAAETADHLQFLGVALNARGEMQHRQGRDALALADLERSISILEETGATRLVGAGINNRADVLISLGRVEEALTEAERALVLVTEHGDPSHPLIARATMARARLHTGEYGVAREILEEVISDFHAMQDTLADPVSQANANYAGGGITYLAFSHSREGRDEEAWNVVEESQARVLRMELVGDSPPASLEDFQTTLRHLRAAALVYGLATVEGCPGFLVTGDDIMSFEVDVRGKVRRAQAEVMEILASGRDSARLDGQLRILGDALVGPATAGLQDGVERLIILPGSFASLPFETLPLGTQGDLGSLYALSYTPSATAFIALEERGAEGVGFFALADPVTGSLEGAGLWAHRLRGDNSAPLPEARAEVRAIAPDGAASLVGEQATAGAFRSGAPGKAVIHVATHAIVDPANPELSALVMAAEGDAEPILLAGEIRDLELNADLVCLSSCGTAGGYQVPGEGTFGLTRSFLVAGSRTVVASWWDVEDGASRRFMELFYEGLREGLDRDLAVQEARRVMEDEGFNDRDRLAFAVVGAVSGPLDGTLESRGDSEGVSRVLLIAPVAVLLLWWYTGRRRRTSG